MDAGRDWVFERVSPRLRLGGEPTPDAQGFGGSPGLGIAATGTMRGVAIDDLRQVPKAAGVE